MVRVWPSRATSSACALLQRDAEVAGEQVSGPGGNHTHRDPGAGQSVGHHADRAVAAGGDHQVDPGLDRLGGHAAAGIVRVVSSQSGSVQPAASQPLASTCVSEAVGDLGRVEDHRTAPSVCIGHSSSSVETTSAPRTSCRRRIGLRSRIRWTLRHVRSASGLWSRRLRRTLGRSLPKLLRGARGPTRASSRAVALGGLRPLGVRCRNDSTRSASSSAWVVASSAAGLRLLGRLARLGRRSFGRGRDRARPLDRRRCSAGCRSSSESVASGRARRRVRARGWGLLGRVRQRRRQRHRSGPGPKPPYAWPGAAGPSAPASATSGSPSAACRVWLTSWIARIGSGVVLLAPSSTACRDERVDHRPALPDSRRRSSPARRCWASLQGGTQLQQLRDAARARDGQEVDQPGAAGRATQLADLLGQLAVPGWPRLGDQLLAPLRRTPPARSL